MRKSLILLAVLLSSLLFVTMPTRVNSTPPVVNLSFTESFVSGINPSSVTVNQGDFLNITVTNNDPTISHTFTVDGYVSYPMAPSQVRHFNFTATHTGSFLIHCLIHPDMTTSNLKVQGPSLTASPNLRNVTSSGSVTYNLNVSSVGTYSGNVSLSIQGDFTGLTATFQRTSLLVTSGGSNSTGLTLNVTPSKPIGTYAFNITASDRGFSSSILITLEVLSATSHVPVFGSTIAIVLLADAVGLSAIVARRLRSIR